MIVKILKKHIELGKKKSPSRCPIALACKDAGFSRVNVGSHHIKWAGGGMAYLPEIAQCFIISFDAGLPVKPFTLRAKSL